MRLNQAEKYEIIRLVEQSSDSVNKTLKALGIHKSTFYRWYNAYLLNGYDGLSTKQTKRESYWNQVPEKEQNLILDMALEHTAKSSREIAYLYTDTFDKFISESTVYRILKRHGLIQTPAFELIKAADEFKDKTTYVNQMWQTDFTYFKIPGWGWYFLSTVIDDYSRYIVHWKLYRNMRAEDAKETIEQAIIKSNLKPGQRPDKVLSDNGSSYIGAIFRDYLIDEGIKPVNGRPLHPQTQGKIERYHRTMKSVIKLDVYHRPEELVKALEKYVPYYNNERYHESIKNVAPADVYFGTQHKILKRRAKIKQKTLTIRRKEYLRNKIYF